VNCCSEHRLGVDVVDRADKADHGAVPIRVHLIGAEEVVLGQIRNEAVDVCELRQYRVMGGGVSKILAGALAGLDPSERVVQILKRRGRFAYKVVAIDNLADGCGCADRVPDAAFQFAETSAKVVVKLVATNELAERASASFDLSEHGVNLAKLL